MRSQSDPKKRAPAEPRLSPSPFLSIHRHGILMPLNQVIPDKISAMLPDLSLNQKTFHIHKIPSIFGPQPISLSGGKLVVISRIRMAGPWLDLHPGFEVPREE